MAKQSKENVLILGYLTDTMQPVIGVLVKPLRVELDGKDSVYQAFSKKLGLHEHDFLVFSENSEEYGELYLVIVKPDKRSEVRLAVKGQVYWIDVSEFKDAVMHFRKARRKKYRALVRCFSSHQNVKPFLEALQN